MNAIARQIAVPPWATIGMRKKYFNIKVAYPAPPRASTATMDLIREGPR
jgi:hypothetical protein